MNPLLPSGLLALCLAASGPLAGAAQAAGEPSSGRPPAEQCRVEVSQLRYQVAGKEGLKEGDHELLAGLSAEEASEPQENWFGSPPEAEALLEKLDEAGRLAGEDDADACRALVEEVRNALRPDGEAADDG